MGNKVFIIQLMNGKTEGEILAERIKAERQLREWGYDPIGSYIDMDIIDMDDTMAGRDAPVWYLGRSIERLSEADYIYLCKDWEKRSWLPNRKRCSEGVWYPGGGI